MPDQPRTPKGKPSTPVSKDLSLFVEAVGDLIRRSLEPGNEKLHAYIARNLIPVFDAIGSFGDGTIATEEKVWDKVLPILKKNVLKDISAGVSIKDHVWFISIAALCEDYDFFKKLGRQLHTRNPVPSPAGVDRIDVALYANWEKSIIFPVPLKYWKQGASRIAICWLCGQSTETLQPEAFRKRLGVLHLKRERRQLVNEAEIISPSGTLALRGPGGPRRIVKADSEIWWKNKNNFVQDGSATPGAEGRFCRP